MAAVLLAARLEMPRLPYRCLAGRPDRLPPAAAADYEAGLESGGSRRTSHPITVSPLVRL